VGQRTRRGPGARSPPVRRVQNRPAARRRPWESVSRTRRDGSSPHLMPTGDCTIVVAATTPSTTGTPIRALMSTARSAIPAQPSTMTSQPSSATARAHSCVIAVRAAEPGISSSRTGTSLARTLLQNPDAVAGGQVPRPPNGPLQRRHDGEPPAEVGGQLCRWANRCRSESPWRVRGLGFDITHATPGATSLAKKSAPISPAAGRRRQVAAVFAESPFAGPVEVFCCSDLDVSGVPPWPARFDQSRLVQSIDPMPTGQRGSALRAFTELDKTAR
jgi:hypothetical protein